VWLEEYPQLEIITHLSEDEGCRLQEVYRDRGISCGGSEGERVVAVVCGHYGLALDVKDYVENKGGVCITNY